MTYKEYKEKLLEDIKNPTADIFIKIFRFNQLAKAISAAKLALAKKNDKKQS